MPTPRDAVTFTYTNHCGETAVRRVVPKVMFRGTEFPWYTEAQWLLVAFDLDKRAYRTFAMEKIIGWRHERVSDPQADPISGADRE